MEHIRIELDFKNIDELKDTIDVLEYAITVTSDRLDVNSNILWALFDKLEEHLK